MLKPGRLWEITPAVISSETLRESLFVIIEGGIGCRRVG